MRKKYETFYAFLKDPYLNGDFAGSAFFIKRDEAKANRAMYVKLGFECSPIHKIKLPIPHPKKRKARKK